MVLVCWSCWYVYLDSWVALVRDVGIQSEISNGWKSGLAQFDGGGPVFGIDCCDVMGKVEKNTYGSLVGDGECKMSVGFMSDHFVFIVEDIALKQDVVMTIELSQLVVSKRDGVLARWVMSITKFHGSYWVTFVGCICDFGLEQDLVNELWLLMFNEMWQRLIGFEIVVLNGVFDDRRVDDSEVMFVRRQFDSCCLVKWMVDALVEVKVGICHAERI